VAGIAFTTALAVVLVATGDLATLADTTVLLLLFVFTIVNVAVLVLRREEVEHEHFQAPSLFPVVGGIVAVALIAHTASDDLSTFARAGGLVALGVILYFINLALSR
jgi:basic amino acid/polyamine antiporter, APA family